jgi:ABC-type branched-subunit amino acid transport system substrate-binding protein
MIRSLRTLASAVGVLVLVLALSACGSKGGDSSNAPSTGSNGASTGAATPASVKTGPGITATSIKLGVITDLSGVFAPLTSIVTHANQQYWKERNAQGGVCDRTVDLEIKDYGYDVQKGVIAYRDVAPSVAAIQQLVGSPLTTALLPTLKTDRMLSVLAAWPSSLLGTDFIVEVGAPYDIEIINGLSYVMKQGKIKSGDKIGHLYFEGEYGENGLKGSQAFAKENGMSVVKQKIQPTDEDMSGQVAAFKKAGVKAISVTTSPTALASLAGIAAAQGLNVPIVGNNPTFDPALLKTPAAKALKANAIVMGSILPYASKTPKNEKIVKDYSAAYPKDAPKAGVQFGFAQGRVMYAILSQACEDGDLSRDGIVKAARKQSGLKMAGLVSGDLDYSQIGEPSTRATFVSKVADVKGGLKQVGAPSASSLAQSYDPSAG